MLEPNQIPIPQGRRVLMFQQRYGMFEGKYNAYWSLRMGRKATLAEGRDFDAQMRAGLLAPVWRGPVATSNPVPPIGGPKNLEVLVGTLPLTRKLPSGPPPAAFPKTTALVLQQSPRSPAPIGATPPMFTAAVGPGGGASGALRPPVEVGTLLGIPQRQVLIGAGVLLVAVLLFRR